MLLGFTLCHIFQKYCMWNWSELLSLMHVSYIVDCWTGTPMMGKLNSVNYYLQYMNVTERQVLITFGLIRHKLPDLMPYRYASFCSIYVDDACQVDVSNLPLSSYSCSIQIIRSVHVKTYIWRIPLIQRYRISLQKFQNNSKLHGYVRCWRWN